MSFENKTCEHIFNDDDNTCLKCNVTFDQSQNELINLLRKVNSLKDALKGVRIYISAGMHMSKTPESDQNAVRLIEKALEDVS